MADRLTLYVSPDGPRWKVQWEGGKLDSHHGTQAAAISRARAVVRGLPAGACSQILVQGTGGQFRAEWTYGKDPYPPAG